MSTSVSSHLGDAASVRLSIRQDGLTLPTVTHEGRVYLVAPSSGSYEIVLENLGFRRREAVVTVDGLSVLDGKLAKKSGNGYVLEPFQMLVIPGWRRSDSEVARFEFKPNTGSYSEAMGHGTQNTGVVGVAVFEEKVVATLPAVEHHHHHHHSPFFYPYVPWVPRPNNFRLADESIRCNQTPYRSVCLTDSIDKQTKGMDKMRGGPEMFSTLASADADASVGTSDTLVDLGTGYGARAEMRTRTVAFERKSSSPSFVISLYYATQQMLESRGIVVVAVASKSFPDPFPVADCPAPAGWSG